MIERARVVGVRIKDIRIKLVSPLATREQYCETHQDFGKSTIQLIGGGHRLLAATAHTRLPHMMVLGAGADVVAQILLLERRIGMAISLHGVCVLVLVQGRLLLMLMLTLMLFLLSIHVGVGDMTRFDCAHYGCKAAAARRCSASCCCCYCAAPAAAAATAATAFPTASTATVVAGVAGLDARRSKRCAKGRGHRAPYSATESTGAFGAT